MASVLVLASCNVNLILLLYTRLAINVLVLASCNVNNDVEVFIPAETIVLVLASCNVNSQTLRYLMYGIRF